MSKKANRIYLILILILGFFVFNLVFPQYLNQGIDLSRF